MRGPRFLTFGTKERIKVLSEVVFQKYAGAELIDLDLYLSAPDEFKTDICLCAGGDGSLHALAKELLKNNLLNKLKVCYFPMGTGNDFARANGLLDLTPLEILELREKASAQNTHVAYVDELPLVNVASFGNFATVTPSTNSNAKSFLGSWAYYLEASSKLLDLNTYSFALTVDGQKKNFPNALGFFIANSCYTGGGVQIAPQADAQNKQLHLLVVNQAPLKDLLALTLELQKDVPDISQYDAEMFFCKKLELSTSKDAIPSTIDGEAYSHEKAQVGFLSEGLSIFLP